MKEKKETKFNLINIASSIIGIGFITAMTLALGLLIKLLFNLY